MTPEQERHWVETSIETRRLRRHSDFLLTTMYSHLIKRMEDGDFEIVIHTLTMLRNHLVEQLAKD